jgi:predicted DNA-binding transcriptional regulator AlpA
MHLSNRFDQNHAAEYLGLSVHTLEKWRSLKKGPAYLKVGHFVRYTQEDLENWISSQRVRPEEFK